MTDPKQLADMLQKALDTDLGSGSPYVRFSVIFVKELEMVLRSFSKDATRYRWLRDRHDHDDQQAFVYGATGKLDEYIDAQMAASRLPQESGS